ncbi:MAG: EamA family transporter [Alphaproteobacteria bacterium]
MSWFFFALITAIFWGLGYALSEKLLHNGISGSFLLTCIYLFSAPLFIFLSLSNGTLKTSIQALTDKTLLLVMIGTITAFIFGNLFIMQAINLKNATYANLIEISYPLFTVLFTYFFFRTVHLDWITALGGLMIISGALLIFYKGT